MKFSLRMTVSWILGTAALGLVAQSITTDPAIVTEDTKDIVITFHSDGGNRGLADATASTGIYAHTGVITNLSNGTWVYAPASWGDNSEKYKLTYTGPFTWELKIPDIRSYYGITNSSEKVEKLAFVFRNADSSAECHTGNGGDIFLQLFPAGFPTSKAADYPGGIPKMGAEINADGSVTFCLAAPGKNTVVMMGSWNNYTPSADCVMNYQDYNGIRYFWLTLNNIEKGKDYIYYYNIDGTINVGDPYAHLILDSNDQYINSSVFPNLPAYPSDRISGVPLAVFNTERDVYDWKINDFKGVAQSDLIIYELLIRDFTGTEGKSLGDGTVKGVIEKLDYLKELGVNAIELLPIMEFAGNLSWGYNTNFYMAPDKAYGTPDDYRTLIDGAHERGMAVILDIVFNQSDGGHPWYDMVRRNINPFYNGSAPHAYSVLNDWNQDCELVQQQWHDVLDYWLTAYKVDGFRFDLVKGLGNNDSYGNTFDPVTNTWSVPSDNNTNRFNATRVERMKELHAYMKSIRPDAYFINENLAGSQEENDMARDGEINWANINWAARNYVIGSGDMSLNRFYAPYDDNRLWGSTVSYAESHDEERLAYNATTVSTICKGNFTGICRRIGSMAAQMLLTPGAHMIWQFEEMGNMQTTKNSSGNDTGNKKVSWNDLNNATRKGLHDSFAALCNIRSSYPYLFRENVSSAIDLKSTTARYISLADGNSELYLVVNPAAEKPTVNATVPFPTNPSTGQTAWLGDSRYQLLAASHSVTPEITATGITLPAGAFAVYGAGLESGIDEIKADSSQEKPVVVIEEGRVRVVSPYSSVSLHNLSGMSLNPTSQLGTGVYLVTVDGVTVKIAVM